MPSLSLIIATFVALAQPSFPSPFASCSGSTGASATVLVPTSAAVLVDGQPLEVGDEVAALTQEGVCAGTFVWTGEPKALAAWLDNPFSEARDGFNPGETIELAVWRAATGRLHREGVTFAFEPSPAVDGTFQQDALYFLKGQAAVEAEPAAAPSAGLALAPNAPNPFGTATTISYTLPEPLQASLVVYDLLGRTVARLVDERQAAGIHTISFDGQGLASGTYVYRLEAGSQALQRRMTIAR